MGSCGQGAERAAFIKAMRGVAASVTVVATDGEAGRCGATVSAFCSVSADPPTVLACLRADSRIASAVQANGRFCVNVLPQAREALANRFAGMDDHRFADRFEGVDWACDALGMPCLGGATAFSCALEQAMPSGSHLVCIGLVEAVREGGLQPLTYLDGAYHSMIPAGFPVQGEGRA